MIPKQADKHENLFTFCFATLNLKTYFSLVFARHLLVALENTNI